MNFFRRFKSNKTEKSPKTRKTEDFVASRKFGDLQNIFFLSLEIQYILNFFKKKVTEVTWSRFKKIKFKSIKLKDQYFSRRLFVKVLKYLTLKKIFQIQ